MPATAGQYETRSYLRKSRLISNLRNEIRELMAKRQELGKVGHLMLTVPLRRRMPGPRKARYQRRLMKYRRLMHYRCIASNDSLAKSMAVNITFVRELDKSRY